MEILFYGILLYLELYKNGIRTYNLVRFFSPNIVFLSLVHIDACSYSLFIFIHE